MTSSTRRRHKHAASLFVCDVRFRVAAEVDHMTEMGAPSGRRFRSSPKADIDFRKNEAPDSLQECASLRPPRSVVTATFSSVRTKGRWNAGLTSVLSTLSVDLILPATRRLSCGATP